MDMRKSRLSKEKQERLMEHFVAGSTARCASELVMLMGIIQKRIVPNGIVYSDGYHS